MIILHKLFVRVHARYTRSSHVEDLKAFALWLTEHDYSVDYAQRVVFHTMRSLDASNIPPGSTWSSKQLERAFRRYRHRRTFQPARHSFGVFLQSVGRLTPPQDNGPHALVLAAYRSYLSEVQGLVPTTIAQRIAEARVLMRHALPNGKSLKHLNAETIEKHIELRARGLSRASLRLIVGYLRSFLRYCFDHQLIPIRLDFIDRPASFGEELPPRALDWPLVQKFLRSIDRRDRNGWRDFMMLHLMAHYGLRPGEVIRLAVDSIQWEARTLLVEQPKTRSWLTLPLMGETLDLLRRYLREGRRQSRRGELFSSSRAPYRPMLKTSVTYMFKRRARMSGLPMAHASPYFLRHSFAMRLFARGVGIKAIGDLMGHNSLASTSVYLRLQTDMLRDVALSVPKAVATTRGAV
jgi:integrase/recombinase XerD